MTSSPSVKSANHRALFNATLDRRVPFRGLSHATTSADGRSDVPIAKSDFTNARWAAQRSAVKVSPTTFGRTMMSVLTVVRSLLTAICVRRFLSKETKHIKHGNERKSTAPPVKRASEEGFAL
ncbi:MAG: hypothetical protein ACEY26_00950 [Candidatus Hodgkinia cicadicola]